MRRRLLACFLVPLALVVVVGAAWAIDLATSGDRVVRNVTLGGRPVGGLDEVGLVPVIETVADDHETESIRVATPEGDFSVRASELGLVVDRDATLDAVLDVGRDDDLLGRPLRWLTSIVTPRPAPVVVTVERDLVVEIVAERDPTERRAPVEPSIGEVDGQVTVVLGQDGRGLSARSVENSILAAAGAGDLPIVVQARATDLSPRFSQTDAERLAERARSLSAAPLEVEAGEVAATVPVETLRGWLASSPTEDGLRLELDPEETLTGLGELLAGAGTDASNARFVVEGGQVRVVPAVDGSACCSRAAVPIVLDALANRRNETARLPLERVEAERTTTEAANLDIVESVGSFTTNFAAGQSRVTNIHRIADLTRGVVIEPGAAFSVNDFVGRRTRDRGFVEGGVIQNGVFEESVGGGISQYATTLFNAAFFAGLDYDAYQSHSIYISRYPRGREATLSFPQPDLVLRNNTPHGVLVWPTYTGSSVTVTLYSTLFATGEQTGQSTTPAGNCTRVRTERTRTYTDGRTETDTVFATYRPEEGVDC